MSVRDADQGEGKTLSGVAIPYNSRSVLIDEDGEKFFEVILPGAFAESIESEQEIMMLYSHDWEKPLARRSAGRLVLTDREDGLYFAATPPDTTRAKDLIKDIGAGNVCGVSFGFTTSEDRWKRTEEGEMLREVVKGTLYEISPVVSPAYPDTVIASRSKKNFESASAEQSTKQNNALRAQKLRLLKLKSKI